jgi:hypothetical protein
MNMIVYAGKGRDFFESLREMGLLGEKGGVVYHGARSLDGKITVCRVDITGDKIEDIKHRVINPADSEFIWGFSYIFDWGNWSASAAQLALALLYDATGNPDTAYRYCQDFKDRFVSTWGTRWGINAEQIRRWVALQERCTEAGRG